MSSAKKGPTLVHVRAFKRPGFSGFHRGGQHWTSEPEREGAPPGRFAMVTSALLAVLEREPHLAVRRNPEDAPEDLVLEDLPVLDLPEPAYIDHGARALDDNAKIKAEMAVIKAQAENARLRAEIAALREQVAGEAAKDGKATAAEANASDKGSKSK